MYKKEKDLGDDAVCILVKTDTAGKVMGPDNDRVSMAYHSSFIIYTMLLMLLHSLHHSIILPARPFPCSSSP